MSDAQIPAALTAPGLVIRASVNLGEQDRILQFEGFVDLDCDDAELDHLTDKMMRAANRHRARFQLPTFRRQLGSLEAKHAENRARKAGVEAQLKAMKDARAEKTVELNRRHAELLKSSQDEHYASGRRGEYKPAGAAASALKRLEGEIASLAENQTKETNEAAVQLSVLDNEIKEGERAIGQLKGLIEEAEAMGRGEDVSGIGER